MNDFEKAYYEAPEFWYENALDDESNRTRISNTASMIPKGVSSLLDVGCGNGIFAQYLSQSFPKIRVTCVDRSETALTHVKTNKLLGEVSAIPVGDRLFEVVTCLQVLEHIPENNYSKALAELARVSLKYLLISVPYREDLLKNATICPNCKTRFNADLHLRSYDDLIIRNLFSEHGFRLTRSENVVKQIIPRGIEFYYKLRMIGKPKNVTFDAPICPVCGFKNASFKKPPVSYRVQSSARLILKRLLKKAKASLEKPLKSVWPRKTMNGYWIIALYERVN